MRNSISNKLKTHNKSVRRAGMNALLVRSHKHGIRSYSVLLLKQNTRVVVFEFVKFKIELETNNSNVRLKLTGKNGLSISLEH